MTDNSEYFFNRAKGHDEEAEDLEKKIQELKLLKAAGKLDYLQEVYLKRDTEKLKDVKTKKESDIQLAYEAFKTSNFSDIRNTIMYV